MQGTHEKPKIWSQVIGFQSQFFLLPAVWPQLSYGLFSSSLNWDQLKQGVGKFFFFFPVKSQIVNILGFVGHTASVPTTQPWSYSMKVATESIGTDGHNCVPVKHYLQKWAGGKNWAMGSSLPTSNIDLYYLIGSIEGWRVNPVHALRTVPYTP